MKKLVSIVLTLMLVASLAACGTSGGSSGASSEKPSESVAASDTKLDVTANVFAIKGPSGVGMVPLMEKAEKGEANLNYNFGIVAGNEEIVAKITSKEADIAAVASNLAATLYKKTNGGITVIAVSTLGVLNIVTKGEEINSIADLKDKTVYSIGQGANPEYILNYVLTKNGLTAGKDVNVEFLSQNEELVTKVVTSEKAIVFAPEPVATTITIKDSASKISLSINDEWGKISDTDLVMGCVIARKEFVENNPKAVEVFLKEYEQSVKTASTDISGTAKLCEKYEIIASAAIAQKAIPNCNLVFKSGKQMKTDLSGYLNILFGYSPASVGGEMPGDAFYYGSN